MSLVAVLLLAACVALAPGNGLAQDASPLWDDLRVHYSPLGRLFGFYKLPRTVEEALAEGYTQPPEETTTNTQIWCANLDPSICVVFDQQGNIAGMELGILRSDVDSTGYPFVNHPVYVPKVRYGLNVYITTVFFVEQDVLTSGGRPSLAESGTGTGLWVKNGDELLEVPRLEEDLASKTAFKRENCVPAMGRHYYYNVSTSMDCDDFEPIFALVREGQLIGFGFQTFGIPTTINKVWYESIPAVAIRPTVPDAPDCLVDNARDIGVISLHIYFVDQPWDITCADS